VIKLANCKKVNVLIITNKKSKQILLNALSDEDIVKILNSTKQSSKSVPTLMELHGISHSTIYRKIKWMLENNLLVTDKIEIREDGKKFSLFKSTIKSINVNYQNDAVTVEVQYNTNRLDHAAKEFFSME